MSSYDQRGNWWMFHGDPAHTGFVADSPIQAENVANLQKLHDLELDGPVLSTPAVVDGFVYVGIANSHEAISSNGGAFYKIALESGKIAATFRWDIANADRDSHGFCGMGCTPAVIGGRVIFVGFNAKLYCLRQDDFRLEWETDLRYADHEHDQPITNDLGMDAGFPVVAGWSSPLVVGERVYLGIGEGENPLAYSFIYCIDVKTGNVDWLYCTCQFEEGVDNLPNVVPAELVHPESLPPKYQAHEGNPLVRGCSNWSSPAYDEGTGLIYCATGNPQPDGVLPTKGYSNGVLALDAKTGKFAAFWQFPVESSYRPSDLDVDVAGAPVLITVQGRRLVAIGCKNGGFALLDAKTLEKVKCVQLLPYHRDGSKIQAIDAHPVAAEQNDPNPHVPNEVSDDDANQGENYSGTYSTPAFHPTKGLLFIGVGGKNYNLQSPGIDTFTTPFLKAYRTPTLDDAWPMDDDDPPRYINGRPPFYANYHESGLAVPAVVNDVVLMSTTMISVYAFSVDDGRTLWSDQLGVETGGFNGGYGYCLGPAVWQDYVVAGALVYGRKGGLLRIYRLGGKKGSTST